MGQAGTAVLDVRGVIAPGTYQDYLEYEFEVQTGGSIHEQYTKKKKDRFLFLKNLSFFAQDFL